MPLNLNRTFQLQNDRCLITVFFLADDPVRYRFVAERQNAATKTRYVIYDRDVNFGSEASHAQPVIDVAITNHMEKIESEISIQLKTPSSGGKNHKLLLPSVWD
ncbi:MAG: hypothetical protein ACREJD_02875 [Phycisphaerales bacterium]